MWVALTLVFGSIIGLSLGLTGGGGAVFAVPMLMAGLGMSAREAVGISLFAVGSLALVGAVARLRSGDVELATAALLAFAGALGSPLGNWAGGRVNDDVLAGLFATLMVVVAGVMWRRADSKREEVAALDPAGSGPLGEAGPACRRDPEGRLRMTSRCAIVIGAAGVVVGFLSGMFGVGGGFIIVPALVIFTGLGVYRAASTSLLVIALVSGATLVSRMISGAPPDFPVAALFTLGGLAGMLAGTRLARRIPGPALQKSFALVIIFVAAFVAFRTVHQ